jgi:hypothetical protein
MTAAENLSPTGIRSPDRPRVHITVTIKTLSLIWRLFFSSNSLSSSVTIRHSVQTTGIINYFNYPSFNEQMNERIHESISRSASQSINSQYWRQVSFKLKNNYNRRYISCVVRSELRLFECFSWHRYWIDTVRRKTAMFKVKVTTQISCKGTRKTQKLRNQFRDAI